MRMPSVATNLAGIQKYSIHAQMSRYFYLCGRSKHLKNGRSKHLKNGEKKKIPKRA
jgi:hypothetical protein